MIEASGIEVAYGRVLVLAGVELVAHPGQTLGLIGPNGSGKTTLLRTMYQALTPRAGLITLDGQALDGYSSRDRAKRIGVVPQEGAIDQPFTAAGMVLLGRAPHRAALESYTRADHEIAARALRQVGARELADRVFATLSGGEKQRVLIARTLAQQVDHLLLDEPTNHLDIRYQHEVLTLVRGLGVTTVVVLHDLNLAARYCDRIVLLHEGRIHAAGTPEEVLTPELLEPVYEVTVRRLVDDTHLQLSFSPRTHPSDGTGVRLGSHRTPGGHGGHEHDGRRTSA